MIDRRTFVAAMAGIGLAPRAARAAAADPLDVPVVLAGNRLLVTATIGGGRPHRFVLDTGGRASLIDSRLARSLHLAVGGQRRLGVGGEAGKRYDIAVARDLVVGGTIRVAAAQFAIIDGFPFGPGVDGSFNGGFMTIYPSELLFDEQRWRLWMHALPPLAGYARMPGAVRRQPGGDGAAYLFGEVVVNGVPLSLGIDTGAPGSLRLTPAAARRVGLDRRGRPTRALVSGGHKQGMLVRTDAVTMGGIDLGRPVALIRKPYGPTFADGLIGLRLLRMMNIAVDPASGELWLRRNRLAPLGDMPGDDGL